VNAYFGNGVKFSDSLYQPPLPASITPEFDLCKESALVEQPDVTEDPCLAQDLNELAENVGSDQNGTEDGGDGDEEEEEEEGKE